MIRLKYMLINGVSIVDGWKVEGFFPSLEEAKLYAEEMKLKNIHVYKLASGEDLIK